MSFIFDSKSVNPERIVVMLAVISVDQVLLLLKGTDLLLKWRDSFFYTFYLF